MSRRRKRNRKETAQSAAKPPSPAGKPLIPSLPAGEHTSGLVISQQRQTATTQIVSGPIPPPQVLREYNEIMPGLAERIVAQAERQTEHRISLENKVIGSDIARSRQGLLCGFIVAIVCVIGGVAVAIAGHPAAGATIATGAVGTLAGVFVFGTTARRSERAEKAKMMTGQPAGPAPDSRIAAGGG